MTELNSGMNERSSIVAMFRRAWLMAQLRGGPPLDAITAVKLFKRQRLREAAAYAKGPDMEGRCFQHNAYNDGSVCWEFESIEDAALFRLKFDGVPERPLDLEKYLSLSALK